ncbi:fatty acid elongase 3-ketoacyl-CoA synthase [Pelomyxa schiedti]|nr:fatty acid elongase 3-ketoacyl-CoA synthase [Pelomyxa schiedti]
MSSIHDESPSRPAAPPTTDTTSATAATATVTAATTATATATTATAAATSSPSGGVRDGDAGVPPRSFSPSVAGAKEQEKVRDLRNVSYYYPHRKGDFNEVRAGYYHSLGIPSLVLYLAPVVLIVLTILVKRSAVIPMLWRSVIAELSKQHDESIVAVVSFVVCFMTLVYLVTFYVASRKERIYLVDFATFTPPPELLVTREHFVTINERTNWFSKESMEFQKKLTERAGLGNETYLPAGILACPPELNMNRSREEAFQVITGCCDELFAKTGVNPTDIDIVIVNCSLFNPTPSLSAMIINKYKMRKDVKNYNLSGMGCSAGLVSVDLARDLLQIHHSKLCLIFSTENISENWYRGDVKSMLLSNVLFRLGGAALLLTNKFSWGFRSKYQLVTTVRVHAGADDISYRAIYQTIDERGNKGVKISRDLVKAVGNALKSNITILAPQVLPYTEHIKYFYHACLRKMSKGKRPVYTPNFHKAFQHFCIHAGGRAIIDGLEENLKLTPEDVLPSRATLYRYGNTSSSSVWYELNYIEQKGAMKRGDKVWQIAFGSGLKCNSAVWRALRTIKSQSLPPPPESACTLEPPNNTTAATTTTPLTQRKPDQQNNTE